MEFISKNYLVIILIGLFFVFALIGYLIDILRKNNEEEQEDIPTNIKPVELSDIKLPEHTGIQNLVETNEKKDNNDADELLKNYDKEINE